MATLNEEKRPEDIIIAEYHPQYCRDDITLLNPGGGAADYVVGDVLKDNGDGTFQQVANADSPVAADAILAENVSQLAGSGELTVKAFVRGPLILNKTQLDYADASAGDITAIDAILLGLGIKLVSEAPKQTTHSN